MNRLDKIKVLDKKAMEEAKTHWNQIAKPLHSMGRFEDDIVQIAGITGNPQVRLDKRAVVVMCGDHGVVAEGVTQSGSEVTHIVARAMAKGDGNINSLAEVYHANVFPVDMGMAVELSESEKCSSLDSHRILDRKVAYGTENIAHGPAMTYVQCTQAITAAMDIVRDLKQEGYQIIVTGEMGIGNTTPSSAITAVLLNAEAQMVTGRGAGLDSEGLQRKQEVVRRAIQVNMPEWAKKFAESTQTEANWERRITESTLTRQMALELLYKLGGYDIAGIVGLYLGGAVYGIPVVVDGFISAVASALAMGICPETRNYMLYSHASNETAGMLLLQYLNTMPVVMAGMCLGEGTGGIMLLPLLDGALAMYHSVHSFDNLGICHYEELT